jgi:ABC-2 type transport system permease protein
MFALWEVVRKEFLQLRRDRKMIPVVLVAPVIQIVLFGYAVNQDVRDVPLVVVDQDHSAASRDLVDRFVGSGYFELAGAVEATRDIEPWLVGGRAQLALFVTHCFV